MHTSGGGGTIAAYCEGRQVLEVVVVHLPGKWGEVVSERLRTCSDEGEAECLVSASYVISVISRCSTLCRGPRREMAAPTTPLV